jgi:hypothetical protein
VQLLQHETAKHFPATLVSLGTLLSAALKMGTLCFSETLVSAYESARRHNPEQQNRFQYRENLKFVWCFD